MTFIKFYVVQVNICAFCMRICFVPKFCNKFLSFSYILENNYLYRETKNKKNQNSFYT